MVRFPASTRLLESRPWSTTPSVQLKPTPVTNMYPNITDGIVLTGFSMSATFTLYFVGGGNFQQAFFNQPLGPEYALHICRGCGRLSRFR